MSVTKPLGSLSESHTPPLDLRDHDPRDHIVQFYADDAFLLKTLSRFIGTALGAGDSAIAIATPEHRDALDRNLRHRGLNMTKIAERGRYVALDASEILSTFLVDGWPDATLFTQVIGDLVERTKTKAGGKEQHLAVFGEMVSLLWTDGKLQAALRLEQLWNHLAGVHSFALHCGYPMKDFYREDHGDLFEKICAEHSAVIPGESYAALATEEARLRNITHLQQRAQALENEIAERKRVEQELRVAHDELECRVLGRTLELEQKNSRILQQAEAVECANQSLRQLPARLLRVQDDERRRIARDLHDSTGQIVALLGMNLYALEVEAEKTNPDLAKAISENSQIVRQISGEIRTISYLLHPPLLDEMGLLSALRWYVEGFSQRSSVSVSLELASDFCRLCPEVETAIFRVIQECLTNIHRHSESPTALIRVYQSSGSLVLEVEDKGKGISPEKLSAAATPGVGLRGMRERIKDLHGELEILSDAKGTRVKVTVPFAVAAVAAAAS
jgi:signal transduction histidine kinase